MEMANSCNILLLRRWYIEVVCVNIWEAPPEKVVDGGKSFVSAPWGASPLYLPSQNGGFIHCL